MNDDEIVQLYWERNERAITESSARYGRYCAKIAENILSDREDVKECVNDTWLRAWDSMPPHKPSLLSAFLGKLTRNLSLDRYRRLHREKRGAHNMDLILDELDDCVSGTDTPEDTALGNELKEAINAFLRSLPAKKRYLFISRYWSAEAITDLAERFQMSENNVSVSLNRIRGALRAYLNERGYIL